MDTAKDMWKVYSRTSTVDLIKNKSRKVAEFRKLASQKGYWAMRERARLAQMIDQIDAVLEARALQVPLF